MQNEERLLADIVEVGHRLHSRAYIASNDGNIRARLGNDRLLTAPKGVSKGFIPQPLEDVLPIGKSGSKG